MILEYHAVPILAPDTIVQIIVDFNFFYKYVDFFSLSCLTFKLQICSGDYN